MEHVAGLIYVERRSFAWRVCSGPCPVFVATQVRCTAGLACTQRLGPGVENMPGELEMANMNPHHTIVCRLEHDGRKLEEGGMVYIQVRLFLTMRGGCHEFSWAITSVVSCRVVSSVGSA